MSLKASIVVEISHHKTAERENWDKVKEILRMMEEARGRELFYM